jgi:hypothetical protein
MECGLLQKEREEYMLEQLGLAIEKLLKENPIFVKKA